MTNEPVISVRNLSKSYRIYDHPLGRLKQALSFGSGRHYREFEALKDVSFDIHKGETVGIIGRNGSGKSTLLQLICGIRKPSSGKVVVNGRVSALLELGAGFHPEFTGRENVFMQGAIMGFTRDEMEIRFYDIKAFAGIGEFIEQPVKTYSSGMFLRLAFAVAISIDPDILVIDEALAVGDMEFQRKCFDRLSRMIANAGMTVILVSHEIRQIQRFCSRTMLIEHGRCILDGQSDRVCQNYYETSFHKTLSENNQSFISARIVSTDEIELLSVHILNRAEKEIEEISSGDSLYVKLRFKLNQPMRNPEFVVGTQTADLSCLSSASTAELNIRKDFEEGVHEIEYILAQFPLVPATYYIRFIVRDENFRLIFGGEALKGFIVKPDPGGANKPVRLLNIDTKWRIDGLIASAIAA